MNLILIGFRGAGKSALAQFIARATSHHCISTDEEFVKRLGPITEYVQAYGWPAFRNLERSIVTSVAQEDSKIIDTGGGVIEDPENMIALKRNGYVVWVKASLETTVERIQKGLERPSLTGKGATEEVEGILAKRNPLYAKYADLSVSTDKQSITECASAIIEAWNLAK